MGVQERMGTREKLFELIVENRVVLTVYLQRIWVEIKVIISCGE